MDRRRFALGLGGVLISAPLPVVAADPKRAPVIGYLGASGRVALAPWTAAFVERLRELGWVDGRDVRIEFRWGDGREALWEDFAREFVDAGVDVIVTFDPALRTVLKATSRIPVVFPLSPDPVGSGLVQSLVRPGGNVTGISLQRAETVGKRIEILREILPHMQRLGVLHTQSAAAVSENKGLMNVAATAGVELVMAPVDRGPLIRPAIDGMASRIDALYVSSDPMISANRDVIAAAALQHGVPTMHTNPGMVQAGGLVSYGAEYKDLFRRSADIVSKILQGSRPADIPVEQPSKFSLLINLRTARSLGVAIPPGLLAWADEIID